MSNMKNLLNYLEKLDLSKKDIKIYIKLLELGPLTVTELADLLRFNRTALYPRIKFLLQKGLILESKDNKTRFEA